MKTKNPKTACSNFKVKYTGVQNICRSVPNSLLFIQDDDFKCLYN
uniref:Uncharacterized protein n=1 Tax=Arundo donax TaxID=35708 RepID=A0A0A9EUL6_ARUDO